MCPEPRNEPRVRSVLALLLLKEGANVTVFLDVSLAHAAPRVGFNTARPLLLGNPRARWAALMEERRPVYERVATLRVSTDSVTPTEIAEEIERGLSQLRLGRGTEDGNEGQE